jgi:drug/metabolite transporter (DMT)-like permease
MLIGLSYALFNALIRKIENEDPLLVFAWIFFWPLFVSLLTYIKLKELITKNLK